MPSQQLQGQLQTQHSVNISNYIMEQYNIKSKTNYRQELEKIHIHTEKQTNKWNNDDDDDDNDNNNNDINPSNYL
jgi:hypothetical protein